MWLPSYTYFDEQRMEYGAAHNQLPPARPSLVWNYQAAQQAPPPTLVQNPLDELESSGLLATAGNVESELGKITERIERVTAGEAPKITCRCC